ncbi:MAG: Rhodanese-like protein [Alphaproteobacteria bacterium]|nr:Rhodanese-like protein [Alphaproteobacteria bacterium]
MSTSVKQMLAQANDDVPRVSAEDARKLVEEGALLVDVRDGTEVAASGKLAGATHVSRGMLEFRADSETPYHDANFRKDRAIIVYCASGGRSALAGKALKDLGYQRVFNLGGFKDAVEAGLSVDVI